MADVGLAMQRALDKTENMKARADAVGELEASGTFEDLTALGSGDDDIDRQLKQLSSTSEVDADLEKMKAELGVGSAAPKGELGAGAALPRAADAPTTGSGVAGRGDRIERRAGLMIVRIATEGQYELGDGDLDELNKLDNAAVAACDADRRAGLPQGVRAVARLRADQGQAGR